MRRVVYFLAALVFLCSSCRFMGFRKIKGNGHLATEERQVQHASRIVLSGDFDVQFTQANNTSVKLEADENLLPYIATNEEGGVLHIGPKRRNTSFEGEHSITVYITTPTIEQVHINGSGSVVSKSKFSGADKLWLRISGSGDIDLDVNTPDVKSEINGSGNITLRGETKTESVQINGYGKYAADELKSEDAKVKIAGSGDVKLFADVSLDVNIAGSGTVLYKGTASVKQKVIGGGEVKKIE